MTSNKALGTHDIARVCHVSPPAVIRWIEDGKIPFFTTGGGHRRVWDKDLVSFMRQHNIPIPPELEAAARVKILIVDDEPQNRRVIERVARLAYPEAEINEAVDGFEAGHKLHAFLPTLVVLDLRLPGIDGVRVCRMIRKDSRLRAIKILAITGNSIGESKRAALNAGADDFLGKPFNVSELTARLKGLLSPGRQMTRGQRRDDARPNQDLGGGR